MTIASPRQTERLRRLVGWTLLLGFIVACGGTAPSPVRLTTPPPAATTAAATFVSATIVTVLDADSFEMKLDDGRDVHVQLLGVDAPDTGKPLRGHANAFTRARLPKGRRVYLERGPERWDDRGRYLAFVWLRTPRTGSNREATSQMINALLLDAGYAEIESEDENPKYGTLFRLLQQEARRARRGIWG
jgi:micrococcal nuclease